jgi:hypothetical protein
MGAAARYRAPTAAKLVPDIPRGRRGSGPANSMPSGIGVGYFDCGVRLASRSTARAATSGFADPRT